MSDRQKRRRGGQGWKRGEWRADREQARREAAARREADGERPRKKKPRPFVPLRDTMRAKEDGSSNPRFRALPGRYGSTVVEFPPVMDLGEHRRETIAALNRVHYALVHTELNDVRLELDGITKISDAVAVILRAELERSSTYAINRLAHGRAPEKGTDSYEVMGGLGIFQWLGLPKPELSDNAVKWFQIATGSNAEGPVVKNLYLHFKEHMAEFVETTPQWRSKFYRALMDATTNTLNHAYYKLVPVPWLARRWWAAGLVNERERTLRFIFWDQGVGIPKTIRRKGLFRGLTDWATSDSALIERAIQEGASRFQDHRRGQGLYRLVDLIDLAPAGELHILSRRGWYRHQKGAPVKRQDFDSDLYGTLIVWTLKTEA